MQLQTLFQELDDLQKIYGEKNLDAIYGCGDVNRPKLFIVFMNPTSRNIASNKRWKGLKAPWIGTKNVWRMFFQLGLISKEVTEQVNAKKSQDWSYEFAENLYKNVCQNNIYITNLAKATQKDARSLNNKVYEKYLTSFHREVDTINPRVIITLGNQVSSVILNRNIRVSDHRKQFVGIEIYGKLYKVCPVYYPVGQGMRNILKAKEDIQHIINYEIKS